MKINNHYNGNVLRCRGIYVVAVMFTRLAILTLSWAMVNILLLLLLLFVERSSSVAECRTRNRESPGLKPPFATVSKFGYFCSLH